MVNYVIIMMLTEKSHWMRQFNTSGQEVPRNKNAMTQPALSPTAVDISLWAKALDQEYLKREKDRQHLLSRAIDTVAAFFQGKKVEHVYLTGSLIEPGHFYPFSDVDIAVEGLQEDFWRVMVDLEDLLDRTVDLIELEKCRFSEAIREKGQRIV